MFYLLLNVELFLASMMFAGCDMNLDIDAAYSNRWFNACECGKANNVLREKIVGGDEYNPYKFPWLVMLQVNGTLICGGSVINDRYVLSAAHCLQARYQQRDVKVLVGKHNRCRSDVTTTQLSVNKIIKHPSFNAKDFTADIMLLRLSMKLTFSKYVRPICLPAFDISKDVWTRFRGESATVIGWGKSNSKGEPTCFPKELDVPILPREICSDKSPTLYCAGFLEGGKDSCQGDSGGPLQILNAYQHYVIIGIVSNGIGCALPKHPGLYTDVIQFLPWIWKNTRDTSNCR